MNAQIYALLTGRKVFDGQMWHVFDPDGVELTPPGGIVWHNPLLWPSNIAAPAVDTATVVPLGKMIYPKRKKTRQQLQNEAILLAIL